DQNEEINSVMLEGVPVGFLVFVNGELATNAGGNGDSNVWVLSDGPLAEGDTVSVLPPPHWSGTVDGMNLLVESGERTLSEKLVQTVQLGTLVVEAVANGVTVEPTHSFGTEGQIIPLNLNASMVDSAEAGDLDESTETTTVRFTGMGEHAVFYVNGAEVEAVYEGNGTYLIEGLSQAELSKLGFKQLNSELVDQDTSAAGMQIGVEAWTVESDENAEPSASSGTEYITLNLQNQQPTNGNDNLIWNADHGALNGNGG